jgi:phosphate-selective porin OprO/OprP
VHASGVRGARADRRSLMPRCRPRPRRRLASIALLALACGAAAADDVTVYRLPPVAPERWEPYPDGSPDASTPLAARWRDGLCLESPGGAFGVRLGGRAQVDASAFTAGPGPDLPAADGGLNPPLTGAANLRRARLRIEGRMHDVYEWVGECDFANQLTVFNEAFPTRTAEGPLVALNDFWLQIRDLPLAGTIRIGNQKDPFGFEHMTSSRWIGFMERSFAMDAFEGPFNEGFLPGIRLLDRSADGRLIWSVGEFKNTANPFGFASSSGGSLTTGRLVYLPVHSETEGRVLHLGVAGRTMGLNSLPTRIDPETGLPTGPLVRSVRFRSRGSIRNGPPGPLNSIYADSGLLAGDWQNMAGVEFAAADGPWTVQSEWFGSWLLDGVTTGVDPINSGRQPPPGTPVGTVFYQGCYAEVLYCLTGERRRYDAVEGCFDRLLPDRPFRAGRGAGPGAWQIGARYNYLCLSDGEVNGGVLNGVTLGLNWILTPQARLVFNYDLTHRQYENLEGDSGRGLINGFGTRLGFDF